MKLVFTNYREKPRLLPIRPTVDSGTLFKSVALSKETAQMDTSNMIGRTSSYNMIGRLANSTKCLACS
jgi:hypothetical protein